MTIDVLFLVLLLQVKHVFADFFLQGPYIINNRRFYGHPGGLLHVAIHLVGSLVVLLVMGTPLALMGWLLLAEGVFHYHVDWLKDNFNLRFQLTPRDPLYWQAMGVDQGLHQATYLAMALAWYLWK